MIIGIDTGGTFTDLIYHDGSRWIVKKILSTPDNPAEAVISGLLGIAGAFDARIVHGSTVATNAVLEKKGAKTALITNKGFEDIIVIGRQRRENLYDLKYRRKPPLVPESLRFGISGRINSKGEVFAPLDESEIRDLAVRLAHSGVESIAVSCLFSFANTVHEKKIAEILSRPDAPVSPSYEIIPEFREYERTSTTVVNAYVAPRVRRYINEMAKHIPREKLRIMQSNGGSISADTAAEQPVRTIVSGPAGGVVGAKQIAAAAGFERIITFDMGGTSTDVCLIDQDLPLSVESSIDGFPIRMPMLDIHTVGAGGGSIAGMDEAGALKVGPKSAGADPGPICYGRGRDITVTDANLFMGRLQPDYFLGGQMPLAAEGLLKAFEKLAAPAGLNATDMARGVLDVANTAMERAINRISVEKGKDPAEFVLFAFGGAGGMHAAFLAKLLNIPAVVVPRHPGILSAMGMLRADIIRDYTQTVMIDPLSADMADVESLYAPLAHQGKKDLIAEGVPESALRLDYYADMRYRGQSYEIRVPFDKEVPARFHEAHSRLYGFSNPGHPVELVNIRIRASGTPPEKPALEKHAPSGNQIPQEAIRGKRPVIFDADEVETAIIDRDRIGPGNIIPGPAVVVEYSSTTVVPEEAEARVDAYENLIINLKQ
ncbi:MAG: hydantoinase/oxoprolinase family protein [Desulfobacterales bacterium]